MRRRLADVVAGKLDALLSRLEDPGEALDLAYRNLLERVERAGRAVEEISEVRAGLQGAAADLEAAGDRLERVARAEVERGRRGPAREALARRHLVEVGARSLRSEERALGEEQERFAAAVELATDRARAIGAQRGAFELLWRAGGDRAHLAATAEEVREEAEGAQAATRRAEAAIGARRAQRTRVEALLASGALENLAAAPDAVADELEQARRAPEVDRALDALERRTRRGR